MIFSFIYISPISHGILKITNFVQIKFANITVPHLGCITLEHNILELYNLLSFTTMLNTSRHVCGKDNTITVA